MAHEAIETIQLPNGKWVVIDNKGANKGKALLNRSFDNERAATRAIERRDDTPISDTQDEPPRRLEKMIEAIGLSGNVSPRDIEGPSIAEQAFEMFPLLRDLDIQFLDSTKSGQQDFRKIETFPADERDNPLPGRPTIQQFDSSLTPQIFAAETLHLLKNSDPVVEGLRSEFVASMTDEQRQQLRKQYDHARKNFGESRSFEQWAEVSGIDQWFGGFIGGVWPADIYTSEQLDLFKQLDSRLRGNNETGTTRGRLERMLEAIGFGESPPKLDSFEPPQSFLDKLLPPRVQTEDDVLDVLKASLGLPGAAGIGQAIGGIAKGASRVPSGTLISNVPPPSKGKVDTSFNQKRLDAIEQETLGLERDFLDKQAKVHRIGEQLTTIQSIKAINKQLEQPGLTDFSRAKIKKLLRETTLDNPDTKAFDALTGVTDPKQLEELTEGFLMLERRFRREMNNLDVEIGALQSSGKKLSDAAARTERAANSDFETRLQKLLDEITKPPKGPK